ncbi:MAG: radical SAM protein [Minisyncoccia bacterium]
MQTKEVCWNITARCNQKCRYCHRFLNVFELDFRQNKKILYNLINSGITDLTWTGGEPLLYDRIDELFKIAYNKGVINKLITNGSILTTNKLNNICKNLDSVTLSLDSVDPKINVKVGRGAGHFDRINQILKYFKKNYNQIKIRVNTVISSYNINEIPDLTLYLDKFNIDCWRIFIFMPLRETALKNKNDFWVSDEAFENIKRYIIKNSKIKSLEFRRRGDMESKYVLILADGDIAITDKKGDKKVGNALVDSVAKWF